MSRISQTDSSRRASDSRRHERWAAGAAATMVVAAVAAFSGIGIPGNGEYELRAQVSSANQLREGSEVRIAGVRVGEVGEIGPAPDGAAESASAPVGTTELTMTIDERGLPIHADATLSVRPRLVLEGNAYVRLRPGSPAAGELESGESVPLEQTSVTPQIDQLLSEFDLPTRDSFHGTIGEFATALGPYRGSGGGRGSRSLQRAAWEFERSMRSITRLASASGGTRDGDLGRAIRGFADFNAELAEDPSALSLLVSSTDRFTAALAERDAELAATISELDQLLHTAGPSLTELDRALPRVARLGDDLQPALAAAPGPLRSGSELLAELRSSLEPGELPGLLAKLRPVSSGLPLLEDRLATLFGELTPFTECLRRNVIPTLQKEIAPDGYPLATGDPVWLDLLHAFTGFTGASSGTDGNGTTIRAGLTGGELIFSGVAPELGKIVGGGPDVQGVRPAWLGYGVEPTYRPDVPCAGQPLPDLDKRAGYAPIVEQNGQMVIRGLAPR